MKQFWTEYRKNMKYHVKGIPMYLIIVFVLFLPGVRLMSPFERALVALVVMLLVPVLQMYADMTRSQNTANK